MFTKKDYENAIKDLNLESEVCKTLALKKSSKEDREYWAKKVEEAVNRIKELQIELSQMQ